MRFFTHTDLDLNANSAKSFVITDKLPTYSSLSFTISKTEKYDLP